MRWWSQNTANIEAVAAVVTAVVAVVALLGVKLQIDEADRLQQIQSARDAYRGHLALAVASPKFAQPADACALIDSTDGGAYAAFVDHLLYSAEQMLVIDKNWQATFLHELKPHADYLCSESASLGETAEIAALLETFRSNSCQAQPSC